MSLPRLRIMVAFSMGTEENMLPHILWRWEDDRDFNLHTLDYGTYTLYFHPEILDWVVEPV
jgi:hypothetical protein